MKNAKRKQRIKKIKQEFSKFLSDNVLLADITNVEMDIILSEIIAMAINEKLWWEYSSNEEILEEPIDNK